MGMLINGTTGIQNATWGNTTRPSLPVEGQQGYNTDIGSLEVHDGSNWVAVGGAPSTFCCAVTFNKNATFANTITANGSVGTTSQVLMSGGSNKPPQWVCGSSLVSAASPNIRGFTSSTTFTVTTPGTYTIHVIGGGGGGGATSSCNVSHSAAGGGAGGYARKTALLAAGSYNVTVGSGGPGVSNSSGSNGGTSSFSGPGITTITANGGAGGSSNGGSGGSSGASGGTASGGDVNVTGGGSGSASNGAASGGGSVGISGTGYSSNNSASVQSNGAGVGGSCGSAGNGGAGYAFPFSGVTGGSINIGSGVYYSLPGQGGVLGNPGGLYAGGGTSSGAGGAGRNGGGGGGLIGSGGGGAGGTGIVIVTW